MGENIAKLIDSHFSESIDMSEEQVSLCFCGLIHLVLLLCHILRDVRSTISGIDTQIYQRFTRHAGFDV